jgi:hypothetical protein
LLGEDYVLDPFIILIIQEVPFISSKLIDHVRL